MTSSPRQSDFWRWPALVLWLVFFFVGLVPEWVYYRLRDLGAVTTQRALVNSYYLLPFAMAAFLAAFTHWRCREAAVNPSEARGKALQIWVLSLLAFLPIRLEHVWDYLGIPVPEYRRLILTMAAAKGLAWLYLLSLIVRFHLWSGHAVYQRMRSLLPSTHVRESASPRASVKEPTEIAQVSSENHPENPEGGPDSVREHGL